MSDKPKSVFVLIEYDDDGEKYCTFHNSEAGARYGHLRAIWFDGPDADHAEEAEAYLQELRDKGILRFEGDAPLAWETYQPTELTRLTSLLEECEAALEFYSWDGQVKPDDGKLADAVLEKIRAEKGKE